MLEEINRLRRERNAVILAHNYQIPEIQDLADFVGDSLGLSRAAAKSDSDLIVFCGVHFMAETAAILCPNKRVLIPDLDAGCSLAASITAEELRAWKAEHPGAVVVSYVNTTADVKALTDYCCTSTNAVQVVESIPAEQEILFLPDMYLGSYVKKMTGRENIHVWMGECHVHAALRPHDINEKRAAHPAADFLIHPECGCVTSSMYHLATQRIDPEHTVILSTEGMIQFAESSAASEFIVATEIGILHRMQKANPGKLFIPLREDASCRYMKMITLEKVYHSLRDLTFEVTVNPDTAAKARLAIERMVAIG
ncbi:MAG: quinolinate synthase NadA [Ardenticatenales bacterium]|nr:quinolinate synthase NadA [Ardenticatenales bacterium]